MKAVCSAYLIVAVAILLSGCQGKQKVTGTYDVTTVAGKTITFVLTNEQNKLAELVPHDGSVHAQIQGAVPGVWRFKDDSRKTILVYSWLSGSTFTMQYEVVLNPEGSSLLDPKGKTAGTIKRKK